MTLGEPCGTDEFAAGTATGFLPWLLSPALKFSAYIRYILTKAPPPPALGGLEFLLEGRGRRVLPLTPRSRLLAHVYRYLSCLRVSFLESRKPIAHDAHYYN